MGKYKIRINYKTGNSFGSHNESDLLEIDWDNFDIAKENLQAIKDHYTKVYREIETSYSARKDNQEICKQYQNEWWFVKILKPYRISTDDAISEKQKSKYQNDWENRFDDYMASNCIKLKTDRGNIMQMSCFWCGYFETLIGAKIEVDESDTEFEL